ncbi:MAG TPA: hypothetical protein VKE51_21485, partial [Vicinamibacterales bacterium]|nr:hypothetical protein [Vicinamibacterales bacterium]
LDMRATHGNSGGPVFSQESGRVFGVLSSGLPDDYDQHLFALAESVYAAIDTDMIANVLSAPRRP